MSTRQAVLLIHGIGEQKPMGTLRRFVDAVWTRDTAIHHKYASSGVWSKPDNVSHSFELRRLTTPKNVAGIETHFFEFYWAHLMEGTSYGHVLAWARSLLLRRPSRVPRQLRSVYWLLWVLLLTALVLAVQAAYAKANGTSTAPAWFSVASSLALVPLAGFIVLKVVGDAARYLHVAPTNIQARHEIREAGIALLKELHDPERNYSRIIIVGHSLGTVIGYDMLTHAWLDFNRQHAEGKEQMGALNALEELARSDQPNTDVVQMAQRKYLKELQDNGNSWRVTDFVTLGSPLSHAAILLAKDAADLRKKQGDREFPRCLPALESVVRDKVMLRRFSYDIDRTVKNSYRIPHHAAVFAPTRWTNLFFPCRVLVCGDIVGGPLNSVMGESIRDVPVRTSRRFGLFSHTLYWALSKTENESHIMALRQALDLTDERRAKP